MFLMAVGENGVCPSLPLLLPPKCCSIPCQLRVMKRLQPKHDTSALSLSFPSWFADKLYPRQELPGQLHRNSPLPHTLVSSLCQKRLEGQTRPWPHSQTSVPLQPAVPDQDAGRTRSCSLLQMWDLPYTEAQQLSCEKPSLCIWNGHGLN